MISIISLRERDVNLADDLISRLLRLDQKIDNIHL